MTADPAPPSLPDDDLTAGGFTRTETSVETVFSLPSVQVRTATVQYDDDVTRRALATELDHDIEVSLRFFAGTRLTFDPPLPPGVSPKLIAPMLRSEAQRTFVKRLRERGLCDIDREGSQRAQVGGGRRARVTKYRAAVSLPIGDDVLPLSCWVAPWTTRDDARVVTGGYPAVSIADFFDLDAGGDRLTRMPESYREEFFSLLRGVE